MLPSIRAGYGAALTKEGSAIRRKFRRTATMLTRRIERAKALLPNSDEPIIKIAFQTGWNSLGNFGRVFRDVTGENPSELRAREQASAHHLKQVPHCFVSAAYRPDLLEGRRRCSAILTAAMRKVATEPDSPATRDRADLSRGVQSPSFSAGR